MDADINPNAGSHLDAAFPSPDTPSTLDLDLSHLGLGLVVLLVGGRVHVQRLAAAACLDIDDVGCVAVGGGDGRLEFGTGAAAGVRSVGSV